MVILDSTKDTSNLLTDLAGEGFNASVLATTSLKHVLKEPDDEPLFLSLKHITTKQYEESTTIILVIDEEKIGLVKGIIDKNTNNFTSTKGCFMVLPLEQFEGSF